MGEPKLTAPTNYACIDRIQCICENVFDYLGYVYMCVCSVLWGKEEW